MTIPQYDLTGPATKGIGSGLAVGSVSIGTLHLHKNRFSKYEADVISIETVVIPADGHDTSREIIFLVSPEVGNRQSIAGAVHGLNAITGVIVE